MSLSLIYTTFPDQTSAEKTIEKLLEDRLIVCANILRPITSHYRWEGRLEKSKEIPVFLKTSGDKSQQVMEALGTLHPYDVPAILEIPIEKSSPSFLAWLEEEVGDRITP